MRRNYKLNLAARVLLRCIAALFFVAPIACAQPPGEVNEGERLPDHVLGTWAPISQNFLRSRGDLIIGAEALTWATCLEEPYRVVRRRDTVWLIELVRSPTCPFSGPPTRFWELEISRNGDVLDLTLSMCGDVNEMEKPRLERLCSWGRLRERGD